MKTFALILLYFAFFLVVGIGRAHADSSNDFVVVINSENVVDVHEIDIVSVIRRMYLKQQSKWPDGGDAFVFARQANSAEETAFRRFFLKMTDSELSDHWLQMKQINGDSPPRSVSSTRILLRQIGKRRGAIGVVSRRDIHSLEPHLKDIKVLLEFSDEAKK